MTLATEVTDRIDTQRLVELTNPRDQAATSVDSTLLGKAATDVETDMFPMHAGAAYDATKAGHVTAGVQAVLAMLESYGATSRSAAEAAKNNAVEILEAVANISSRERVSPNAEPYSSEPTLYPSLTDDKFDGYMPGNRPTSGSD